MTIEYLAKLCEAKNELCDFCCGRDCDNCKVQQLIDDAFGELPEEEMARL